MQDRSNKLFYWAIAALSCFLWACENTSSTSAEESYFSLERYFEKEIQRLDREQPQVEKTVMKNDQQEHRSMNGLDWKTELKVFLNSDINKPAWRDSYKVDSSGSGLRYQALEPDLKVRSIHISREPTGQVTGIEIRRSEDNYLFTSEETFRYYPDSLYSIERHQDVRVLGPDRFRITGSFH